MEWINERHGVSKDVRALAQVEWNINCVRIRSKILSCGRRVSKEKTCGWSS